MATSLADLPGPGHRYLFQGELSVSPLHGTRLVNHGPHSAETSALRTALELQRTQSASLPWNSISSRKIAATQFPQCADPDSPWYTGVGSPARSRSLSFRASTRSFLLPAFSRAFFRGSHTTTLVPRGLSRSYSQAALVPSSKVTHKLPRSPWMNSSTVAAQPRLFSEKPRRGWSVKRSAERDGRFPVYYGRHATV